MIWSSAAGAAALIAGALRPIAAFVPPSGGGISFSTRLRSNTASPLSVIAKAPSVEADASVSSEEKRVFLFEEGDKEMRMLLGGKGANLCEMVQLGLPVPPGFVISTESCADYMNMGRPETLPAKLKAEYRKALAAVEAEMGKTFGGTDGNPLLVSVRSGAPASMPGMMDTVLNLGINDEIAAAMAEATGNPRWVYDTYRRFIQMFSDVVMGVSKELFEEELEAMKKEKGVKEDLDLTADDLKELVERYKAINPDIPLSADTQLEMAIVAVFASWFNPRAVWYRQHHQIPKDWGTAVNVQSMVFGNINTESGTGVAFSRNPSTGESKFFGEWLAQAEGEDVVSGVRTPESLTELATVWPDVHQQLVDVKDRLELHYQDMQDLEFTIENGRLFMLQCRNGKRTPSAAVKMAVDMVEEGLITEEEAVLRIPASQMDFFLHPRIDPKADKTILSTGLPASPGAATGTIVFTPEEAEIAKNERKKVILVRKDTTPEDIHGMQAAEGIMTQLGGMTSHAAVVARGMGVPCISAVEDMSIDMEAGILRIGGKELKRGDTLTLDGSKGEVCLGDVPTLSSASGDENVETVLGWADKYRTLKVYTNADTPKDAKNARSYGAEGGGSPAPLTSHLTSTFRIGLTRTEHMFFSPERISVMRAMILAKSVEERQVYIDQLFEFQRDDIKDMLVEMDGLPVTIRMLDPPLHEFLPHKEAAVKEMAELLGKTYEDVQARVDELHEVNPMLGLRGCRLSVMYPEITLMQCKAVITAAALAIKEGRNPKPQMMIPVVSHSQELEYILPLMRTAASEVMEEMGMNVDYELGTMIELPRACMRAHRIAQTGISFMSFGSNDLTQSTWGYSREDMASWVPTYLNKEVLPVDPFVMIDECGVGELMEHARNRARETQPGIKMGVCGEHGGDPTSIEWFHNQGHEYVSCSPFRVPIARMAAAQAAIKATGKYETSE